MALVAALGDAESAERLRGEYNNQYRLLRVVDILLQSGGKPLAGGSCLASCFSLGCHVCVLREALVPGRGHSAVGEWHAAGTSVGWSWEEV